MGIGSLPVPDPKAAMEKFVCKRCRELGHRRGDCPNFDKSYHLCGSPTHHKMACTTCWICMEEEHSAKRCPRRTSKKKDKRKAKLELISQPVDNKPALADIDAHGSIDVAVAANSVPDTCGTQDESTGPGDER